MTFINTLVAVLAFCAATSSASRLVFDGPAEKPNWQMSNFRLNGEKQVSLKIALVPKDAQQLESELMAISTPGSARFRKYLSQDEITHIVGRSDAELEALRNWLATENLKIESVHPHRDWVTVSASVRQVEKLLECQLAQFTNEKLGQAKIGAVGSYSIPSELSGIVRMVAGLTSFAAGRWAPIAADADVSAGTAAQVTPDSIYDNYQVPKSGKHGSKKGSQAVVEFGKTANFNEADLQTFFSKYQPSLKGETCGVVYGENDGTSSHPSVEANLDVQYIMVAGPYVNTTDYKFAASEGIEDLFLDYTQLVNAQNQPPLVHSISYGEYGGSYDNVTDQQFSYELQKMGIKGVSVLLASGDNGVGCDRRGTTQEFDYPSSPYITMVGATYIDSATKKEVGATLSSGGFSKDFMQASWQKSAVEGYFAQNPKMPHEDFYKPGRAYPDIAAYGQNVAIVSSGKTQSVSGTSCSAPIFAGVIALLNDELMSAGQAPLGFLNPWLYANPQMFTDVTSGSNPYQKCDGFEAAKGWDPVTGLGTPLYPQMRTAAFAAVGK